MVADTDGAGQTPEGRTLLDLEAGDALTDARRDAALEYRSVGCGPHTGSQFELLEPQGRRPGSHRDREGAILIGPHAVAVRHGRIDGRRARGTADDRHADVRQQQIGVGARVEHRARHRDPIGHEDDGSGAEVDDIGPVHDDRWGSRLSLVAGRHTGCRHDHGVGAVGDPGRGREGEGARAVGGGGGNDGVVRILQLHGHASESGGRRVSIGRRDLAAHDTGHRSELLDPHRCGGDIAREHPARSEQRGDRADDLSVSGLRGHRHHGAVDRGRRGDEVVEGRDAEADAARGVRVGAAHGRSEESPRRAVVGG